MSDELAELIEKARAYVQALTPEQYREMVRQQAESWVRAEMSWDEDATVVTVPR